MPKESVHKKLERVRPPGTPVARLDDEAHAAVFIHQQRDGRPRSGGDVAARPHRGDTDCPGSDAESKSNRRPRRPRRRSRLPLRRSKHLAPRLSRRTAPPRPSPSVVAEAAAAGVAPSGPRRQPRRPSRRRRPSGRRSRSRRSRSGRSASRRARSARRSAAASCQSQIIPSRAALEAQVTEIVERYPDDEDVPRPARWGGYRITPERVELWEQQRW